MHVRILKIDLDRNSWNIESAEAPGPVSLGVKLQMDMETWNLDPLDPRVPFIIGMGPSLGVKCRAFIG